ncbi:MAG TPA: hypothetical protein VFZ62_00665 [Candidatus Saccharimonadales bacterium]
MWKLHLALPFGRQSTRKFFMFLAATLVASFGFILTSAPHVYAADADWQGDSITYDSHLFAPMGESAGTESHNIPKGSRIYRYTEPAQDGANNPVTKAHLIYFAPGTDPTKATSANYAIYNFTSPDKYSSPSGTKSITLTLKSESAGAKETTSCVIEGIGWIICPITNFLAEAMDWLFNILASFLAVRPAQTDPNNSLFRGWSIMRDFANVAFVIGFLIIIYSQISNLGLSNYGIKRTLPRLIIAAILVNLSYWICAIAIDLSNILGYSLQDIFMGIRNQLTSTDGNSWEGGGWKDISTAILSGGTIAAAGITALVSVGSITGAIYMLLPILVGVLIAALVAIIIMAARQALIVILVMVAPLAFVAYLLPNTEKYFDKWKDLFITMLMLFPIFSVLFGGSQLAGTAIIQNSDTLVMKILGMAVQIAPIVVLPFLIKFSGSLLGRIAGMVNDKSKGLMDRTSNFAKDQAALKKSQVLARDDLRRRNVLSRAVQGMDNRRRKREGWQKVYEAEADNRWHENAAHEAIDTASREASRTHKMIESQHDAHWNNRARTDSASLAREMQMRVAGSEAKVAEARLEAMEEELRTGHIAGSASMVNVINRSRDATRDLALTAMREEAAKRKQKQQLAEELLTNSAQIDGETIREYAGGVMGVAGAEAVLTNAVTAQRKEYDENVQNKKQLIKHFNLSGGERQQLAMGTGPVTATDSNNHTYTFATNDDFAREAAIETQLAGAGNMANMEEIIAASGSNLAAYRTTISNAIVANKLADKAAYLGGKTIDDVAQGKIASSADIDAAATRALAQGKIKPAQLATMDKDAVLRVYNIAFNPNTSMLTPQEISDLQGQIMELSNSANQALTLPSLKGSVAQNVEPILRNIVNRVPPPPNP